MAMFKVGQRVRRVFKASHGVPVGETGTITGYAEFVREYRVAWDRAPWSAMDPNLSYLPESLAPLTDPSADEWARDKVREITRPQPAVLQGEIA